MGELKEAQPPETGADWEDEWFESEHTLHLTMRHLASRGEDVGTLVKVLSAMRAATIGSLMDVTDHYLNRVEEILVGELK